MLNSYWKYYLSLYKNNVSRILFVVFLSCIQTALTLATLLLIKHTFDKFIAPGKIPYLIASGIIIIFVYLLNGAVALLTRHITLKVTKKVVKNLRTAILKKLYNFPRYYFNENLSQLHNIIVQDSERIDSMSNALIVYFLPSILLGTTVCMVLIYFSWFLFLILFSVILLLGLLSRYLGKVAAKRVRVFHRQFEKFSSGILFVIQAIDLTKIQNAEGFETAKQDEEFDKLRKVSAKMVWINCVLSQAQNTMIAIGGIVVLIIGGKEVVDGSMTLGALISFYASLALFKAQLSNILTSIPKIIEGNESLKKFIKQLSTTYDRVYLGKKKIAISNKIALKNVSLSFKDKMILNNVNLQINPGEVIAIKGPNGSGKSTIIDLILGFYRPNSGGIYTNQIPYDEIDIRNLRSQIGVARQHPIIFPGTIWKNITYGCTNKDQSEIIAVSKMIGVYDFIVKKADGYNTIIGDGGVKLSGGEQQKLSITRAILRNPKLLILDEPTNHLDQNAIQKIINAIKNLSANLSVLVISHDNVIINLADSIYNLQQGILTKYVRNDK